MNASKQHAAGIRLIMMCSPISVCALCSARSGAYLNMARTQPLSADPKAQPNFWDMEEEEKINPVARRPVINS